MDLKDYVDEIADFPKEGILFRDISPLLRDPNAWNQVMRSFGEFIDQLKPDFIAGIESRGFIVGSALSSYTNLGFIPIRKKGKLPDETYSKSYKLEYGEDSLEIQKSAMPKNSKILIVDDLLATGGTASTAYELTNLAKANVIAFCFIIELTELNGRKLLPSEVPIVSLIQY